MKFSTAAIVAALAAAASAAPAPQTPYFKPDIVTRDSINDCGDSSFVNQSSTGSPLYRDCEKIASNIAGGGTWTVQVGGPRQLVRYGTCALTVTNHHPSWHAIKVGNQDIIDLIHSSIQKFKWFDKVGAKGEMQCQIVTSGWAKVSWGLHHT